MVNQKKEIPLSNKVFVFAIISTTAISVCIILGILFITKWYPQNVSFDVNLFGAYLSSILSAILVVLSIVFIVINTQKQIKVQSEIVDNEIKQQAIDLKKQIDNQNKESHRPYLNLSMLPIEKKDIQKGNRILIICGDSISDFCSKFRIKNIGVGSAYKIMLYEARRNIFAYPTVTWIDKPNALNLEVSEEIEFTFFADCEKMEYSEIAEVLCFYSDLYGNVYTILMEFTKMKGGPLPGPKNQPLKILAKAIKMEHTSEISPKFDEKIKKLNININSIIRKYERE